MIKYILLTITLLISYCYSFAQDKKSNLNISSFHSYKKGPNNDVAKEIIKIANAVLNSDEFRDSLQKVSFVNANNCNCNSEIRIQNGKISGYEIYKLLQTNKSPSLNITIRKKSKGTLGRTTPCTNEIISYYSNVVKDMPELNDTAALAVNICHEYMHSLGFCHPDNFKESDTRADGSTYDKSAYNEDVAYRIGWIVFDILNRWINVDHKKFALY